MGENFKEKVSKKRDAELFDILVKRKAYYPELVDAALVELTERKLSADEQALLQTIQQHIQDEKKPEAIEYEPEEKVYKFKRSNNTVSLILIGLTFLYVIGFVLTQVNMIIPAIVVMFVVLLVVIYLRSYLRLSFALIWAVAIINAGLLFIPSDQARVTVNSAPNTTDAYNPVAVMIYVPLILIAASILIWYFTSGYVRVSKKRIVIDTGLFNNKIELLVGSITEIRNIEGFDMLEIHYAKDSIERIRLKFFNETDRKALLKSLEEAMAGRPNLPAAA